MLLTFLLSQKRIQEAKIRKARLLAKIHVDSGVLSLYAAIEEAALFEIEAQIHLIQTTGKI